MASTLTTGSSGGTQSTTQSPQAAGGASGAATNSGSVQPGTSTSLLNTDKGGISLNNQSLTAVNIGARQSTVSQFAPPEAKQTSPALYGVSGVLFIIAVVLFWMTMRSAKNTTES